MAGLEGKTLDHYVLQRLIGRGGMADVYEAYDSLFRRKVAIKVFKREDDELLRRFIREAKLMASLKNEHLLPIYGSGECEVDGFTQYYIVMPFMEGGTLRARIRRSPLSLEGACQCLRQIASALDYIHSQGIIHRDIKSSNVLLSADGDCYLSDFGIARMTTEVTQLTSTGNVLGTVDYVAPELFEDNRRADPLSDLYSLGVLLYEIVTGRLPFYAENQLAVVTMHINKPPPSPHSLNSHISPQVERVMLKALAKKPELRYQSATELAEAFCHAVTVSDRGGFSEHKAEPLTPFVGASPASPLILRSAPSMPAPMPPLQPNPMHETPRAAPLYQVSRPIETRPAGRIPRPKQVNPARRRAIVVTILALLALLAVAVPILVVANSKNNPGVITPGQTATTSSSPGSQVTPTATPNLTATAQAAATATAVAEQHATATAIAGVTATAQAQASATAGVIQTATAGKLAYQDALNDPNNPATQAASWDQTSQCVFQSDGYHVMEAVNLHGCRESANTYSDAAISVDVRIHSGHSGGLFFRVNVDTVLGYYSGGYLFETDSQGNYKISTFNGIAQAILDWTPSSALKKGNHVTNTLQVVARGSKLLFYANGVFLKEEDDSTYTTGVIAFLATSSGSQADVVYSNLKVYPLS